jgi:Heterokaryon incompatibility protein (HET)
MGLVLTKPLQYEYTPFKGPRQIRLINLQPRENGFLQCDMEIVDLDNAPPFTALSYTHGPPVESEGAGGGSHADHHLVPMMCGGREILIKPNLASALERFCQLAKYGRYWIDAVCINQQDKLELGPQVMMMGDIYSIAARVLVWLGEEDDDSKIAVIFMEKLLPKFEAVVRNDNGDVHDFSYSFSHPDIYHKLGIETIPMDIWDGLAEFFERRWFLRVWTFQEALLQEKLIIYCGTKRISWRRLEALLCYLERVDWRCSLSRQQVASGKDVCIDPGAGLGMLVKLRNRFFKEDQEYQTYLCNIAGGSERMDLLLGSIEDMICQMRARAATDPRDHFFSLYGTISRLCAMDFPPLPHPLISPDYTKTVADVFAANIKSLLAKSQSLLLLSHVEDRSQRSRMDLPSWVPDMTVGTTTMLTKQGNGGIFNACNGAPPELLPSPNLKTLSLVGHFIDTIIETGDSYNSIVPRQPPFNKSALLIFHLPKIYLPTGQDRVEAFWRTLIADLNPIDNEHPAPASLGQAFRYTITVPYALVLTETHYQGPLSRHDEHKPSTTAALQAMAPLLQLATTSPLASTLIPPLTEIIDQANRHICIYDMETKLAAAAAAAAAAAESTTSTTPPPADTEDLTVAAATALLESTTQAMRAQELRCVPFARQLRRIFTGRRLFRTERGFLGIGPLSLREGDQVFVLAGGRVPFVLRDAGVVGNAVGAGAGAQVGEMSRGERGKEDGVGGKYEDGDGENGEEDDNDDDAINGGKSPCCGCYELIGEAYVHGIMQGEAFRDREKGEDGKKEEWRGLKAKRVEVRIG